MRTKVKKRKKKKNDDGDNTNVTFDDDLLFIEEQDKINITDSASSWIINSGTSEHVTSKRNIFCSYTLDKFGDVKLTHKDVLALERFLWR